MSSPALPATIKLSIFSNACIIVCPSFTVSFFNKTKDSLTACLASVRCSCPPNNACASLLAYAFEESSKSPIFSFAVKIRATASFKRSSLILSSLTASTKALYKFFQRGVSPSCSATINISTPALIQAMALSL